MEKISSHMEAEFATGFLFIFICHRFFIYFYFWLRNGKNHKMYFSSPKELENLFLKIKNY